MRGRENKEDRGKDKKEKKNGVEKRTAKKK